MNPWLAAAAALVFVIGAAHSVLGERLIFRHLRARGAWVPTRGQPALREHQLRILWGCWHGLTALGWSVAAALAVLARQASPPAELLWALAAGLAGVGVIVLVSNRGRHPAWSALWLAAALTLLGQR